MNDTKIRMLLLQKYYEMRRQDFFLPKPEDFNGELSQEDILHCSDQLGQLRLIEFRPLRADIGGLVGGMGRITAHGIEEVESTQKTPVILGASTKDDLNSDPNTSVYKFDVAISFAGEDRAFAEAIAKGLLDAGVEVFYDEFYAADLWGEDLSTKLREVYHDSSEFCIVIVSQHYVDKMWTSFERQQAIERLVKQKGKAYVLPVRLGGFSGDVPALSGMIGYLSVQWNEPEKVVNAFLEKIGRKTSTRETPPPFKAEPPKPHIPKLKRSFTDKEKNMFLKESFAEIVDLIEQFLTDTKNEHPHFDYDTDRLTSRKAVFTLYSNEKQITQFKIWLGSSHGSSEISFLHGNYIDIENDNSMNESIYLEAHEGELKLKPLGMPMFGMERDKLMSPREVAEYLWAVVCRTVS